MIKSFRALGTACAVDSMVLCVGISEALVNTATGTLAIISYSYFNFSNRIDNVTYVIDEISFIFTQVDTEISIS